MLIININISELLNQKFILLYTNCYTHPDEQYYFPAEIALLEFNLKHGVLRSHHELIGLCKYKNILLL